MRTCPKCSEEHDRRYAYCKPCAAAMARAWRRAHPERAKAIQAKSYLTRRDRQRAAQPDRIYRWDGKSQRICSTCLAPADGRPWQKNSRSSDGLAAKCLACHRIESREWARRNLQQKNDYRRRWNAEHSDEAKTRRRVYREKNKERLRLYQAEQYRRTNGVSQRNWAKANPEKVASNRARRRVRRRIVGYISGHHTHEEWIAKLVEFEYRCARCGADEKLERDHIVPLSKGGTDLIANIQPLCRSCNARKSARLEERNG